MMRRTTIFLLLLWACNLAYGQDFDTENNPNKHVEMYLGVQVGVPLEDFRAVSPNAVGVGGALGVLATLKQSPFLVGGEFSYLNYGVERNTLNANTSDEFDIRTSNNIVSFHGVLRFRPKVEGPIIPYFDGMVGTKVFNTRTKITYEVLNLLIDDSEEEIIERFNDPTFSYGGGMGLSIHIGSAAFLDVRAVYLYGSRAEYVAKRSVTITNGDQINYEKRQSRTDMLNAQISLAFIID